MKSYHAELAIVAFIFPLIYGTYSLALNVDKEILKRIPADILASETTELIGVVGRKAFFKDANNTRVDFLVFNEFCHGQAMRVAQLLNQDENDLIRNFYASTKYEHAMWLGGWDMNHEGQFEWLDGTPFNFTAWDSTQPTNDRKENCVVFGTNGYSWYDAICSARLYVSLCELELTF